MKFVNQDAATLNLHLSSLKIQWAFESKWKGNFFWLDNEFVILKESNDEPEWAGCSEIKTDRKVSELCQWEWDAKSDSKFQIQREREHLFKQVIFRPLILIWRYWIDPLQRSPPLSHRIKLHRQELSLFRSAQSHGRAGTPFVQTALSWLSFNITWASSPCFLESITVVLILNLC